MTDFTRAELFKAASSPRFTALAQLGVSLGDLVQWDPHLLRDPRLLVPVDVNALVVRGDNEPMIRLGFRDSKDQPVPDPSDPGAVRADGVHLLWSVPAAFGRGRVVDDPAAPTDRSRRVLELPPLPDRWVVLRLAVPIGASVAHVKGWVLEADAATVTPLSDWPSVRTNTVSVGTSIPADRLTAHVGGAGWTTCYDAALGRLSMHDPLDDLDALAPNGIVGDALSYVVGGWWSDTRHDPLDGVGSIFGYHDVLDRLGWNDADHPEPIRKMAARNRSRRIVSKTFNLPQRQRFMKASAKQASYVANSSAFAQASEAVASIYDAPTQSTLLTGRIHAVPWRSNARPDDRPLRTAIHVAFGPTSPSVAAVLASGAMAAPTTADQQRDAERLLTAFNSGLLARIDNADVWPEIEHYEHVQGFGSVAGGTEAVDRFRDAQPATRDPGSDFRPGRRESIQREELLIGANVLWSTAKYAPLIAASYAKDGSANKGPGGSGAALTPSAPAAALADATAAGSIRSVPRPELPYSYPVSPVLAITGPGRRIGAAERDEADGVLQVRTAEQPERGSPGLIDAADLLQSIGSGAVPDEMLDLARESLAADPFLVSWRADQVRGDQRFVKAAGLRLRSEAMINYSYYAGADKVLSSITGAAVSTAADRQLAVEGLIRHSTIEGVWAHPEGVTMWGQPWRPQFCEWTVELELAELAELCKIAQHDATDPASTGWSLDQVDFERDDAFGSGQTITIVGRSPLHAGVAKSLAEAMGRWLEEERQRNTNQQGLASDAVESALAGLQQHLANLDVLSVSLDGIREQLLGLRYDRGLIRDSNDDLNGVGRALAVGLPQLVQAGRLRLRSARLVDSFGRLLDMPVEDAVVAARCVEPALTGAVLRVRPRIPAPTRVNLRLVDPLAVGSQGSVARTAVVDQVDPALHVNPVAGFLLPDHIDEALELFSHDGKPLGQISHDAFSDAVFWEGAPGRLDIGPAAGPTDDPDPDHQRLGWIAASLVAADASARQATPTRPESESPLSALLRAIDTTLWTVDPFGSLGREHIAGLVGRPIAVVTAELTLDLYNDIDDLAYTTPQDRIDRQQAFAELAAIPFVVQLGSVLRSDDGLLGYYVDDDYSKLHVIHRAIVDNAKASGRCVGDLGVDPSAAATTVPIDHPYIANSGHVTIRHGQTRRLTLLMHPGGKVHITSGIVPRTSVALSRDWVHPGLSVLAPSVRVGPLLIDADKVRLPKVSAFPADQLFTRRDSPGSWKDDPILSATQSAYLPDQASTIQEGWIRIDPKPAATSPNGTGGGS